MNQTTTEQRAPSASYCSPDAPLRFTAGLLAVVLVLALAVLLMACGPGRVEACASAQTGQAVCR